MAECRWLDDEEQHAWRVFLGATRLLFAQLERELQQDAGMPITYYEVLVQLSEAPEEKMRMSELADVTQASRSRLSHAIGRLEDLGWVCREGCPTDRRGAFAVLTDAGRTALADAAPGHVESVRRHFIDQLATEDLSHLSRLSERLLDHFVGMGLPSQCPSQAVQDQAAQDHAVPDQADLDQPVPK